MFHCLLGYMCNKAFGYQHDKTSRIRNDDIISMHYRDDIVDDNREFQTHTHFIWHTESVADWPNYSGQRDDSTMFSDMRAQDLVRIFLLQHEWPFLLDSSHCGLGIFEYSKQWVVSFR